MICRKLLFACATALLVRAQSASPDLDPAAQRFIEQHFASAKEAEAFQQYPRAASEYELILKSFPRAIPEIYQNLGLAYYLDRRYEEALGAFAQGLKLRPGMAGAQLFSGASLLALDRPPKALPFLETAHRLQPTAESATYLGLALSGVNRHERAADLFRFAQPLSTRNDYYLHLIGTAHLRLSEQIANRVAEKYPDSLCEHWMTAKIVDGQGWYQIAAKEYLEAARRDPLNGALFYPLARWLAVLGLDSASDLALARYKRLLPLEQAARIDRSELPKKELADVGITLDYEAALKSFGEPNSVPPIGSMPTEVNAEIRKRLTGAQQGQWKRIVAAFTPGQFDQARIQLEGLRPAPGDWLRDYLLASFHLERDEALVAEKVSRRLKPFEDRVPTIQMLRWDIHRQLSFQAFQRLLDDYPTSGWTHFLRGRTLDSQGKREAGEHYLAALEADPILPEVRIALADFYLSNSQVDAAREQILKELEANPRSSSAKLRLGRIHVQMREPDLGVPLLKEAVAADPDDAGAHADLARGLELQGNTASAIGEYREALRLDPSLNRVHYVLARLYRKAGSPELAEREYAVFEKNEATARQQRADQLRKLRELDGRKVNIPGER